MPNLPSFPTPAELSFTRLYPNLGRWSEKSCYASEFSLFIATKRVLSDVASTADAIFVDEMFFLSICFSLLPLLKLPT